MKINKSAKKNRNILFISSFLCLPIPKTFFNTLKNVVFSDRTLLN
ncbi:hypothetical protein HMPREF9996_02288 [Aggregatibacter actinomycetemcomitans Y4]|nr:hypothetical protein HMPREF9996_02288 [Aggregatibacter actinomycetemcomitans Y4]